MFKKFVDARIEKEFSRRKEELERMLREEESSLRFIHSKKIEELNTLNSELSQKIQEVKKVRETAENEQKRLWERLDILRDNLNSEQVWMRLWESAFSKAVDVVWGLMKENTEKLIILAKEEKEKEVSEKLTSKFKQDVERIFKSDKLNKELLSKKYDDLYEKFLEAERTKQKDKAMNYKAQMEILNEILS